MATKNEIVVDVSEVKKEPGAEANHGKPYDAQIAIEDAEQKRNEVIFTFPYTTVLYLRCSKNAPSRMRVTIKVPGDSAGYEKELGLYENDAERLEELKETYRQIMGYLDRKLAEGNLTAFQCWVIQETTRKVAENLAVKYEKVREGVAEITGGQVLELECVKQWNAGMEEGRNLGKAEGENLGRLDGLSALVKTLKPILNDFDKVYEAVIGNETYADVTKEKVMEYYR